jgi:hypothetical protein
MWLCKQYKNTFVMGILLPSFIINLTKCHAVEKSWRSAIVRRANTNGLNCLEGTRFVDSFLDSKTGKNIG